MGRGKDVPHQNRDLIIQFLLLRCNKGKPAHGSMLEAAQKFNCSSKTVTRIWASAKQQQERGEVISTKVKRFDIAHRKKVEYNRAAVEAIHLRDRSTIKDFSDALHVSKSVLGRWVKQGLIKAHTNAIKPALTAPNKLSRLSFSLQAIEYDKISKILKYKSMYNTVHIDEKWFYITKGSKKYYMTPEEADPHRSCNSKKFITKVMFMCVVCRPIFGPDGEVIFNGKIGIFPFTEQVQALRGSKNRAKGTWETKAIESVTKKEVKECILNQIIPAIKAKWPEGASKRIYIQQDNAKPHIVDSDAEFRVVASADGFDMSLVQQPPNSPDTNVNDLGWFRAIQSFQYETYTKNVDSLVAAVVASFEQLDAIKLNNVFLSLQCCLTEILKVQGHNNYKQPHMKKWSLIRQDALPIDLEVDEDLVRESLGFLIEDLVRESLGFLIEEGAWESVADLMNDLEMHGN